MIVEDGIGSVVEYDTDGLFAGIPPTQESVSVHS